MHPIIPVLTWFLLIAFFCLLIAFCALLRYRKAQRAALQRLRDQLAADLHDDIGANLSQLAILSEVLHHQVGAADTQLANSLSTMAHIARETMSALGDIVWETNPQQDSLTNLLRRMRRFANETLPAAGIEFSFHVPKLESELRLDVGLRRQIFLIFKESLNNLIQHSGCCHATLEVRIEGASLTLQISDDGSGFDCAQPQEGNGVRNLHRRAHMLGADFSLTSSPNGTTILLRTRLRQTTGQIVWQWLSALRRQCQYWLQLIGVSLRSYLNRGVTAWERRPTLPSQPINTAAKESSVRH